MFRFFYIFCALAVLPCALNAALVWTEGKGWAVEGGLLENFVGKPEDAKSALEAMNKARDAQEKNRRAAAIDLYALVVARYPNSLFAPEALFQSGKLYVERRQFSKANRQFQEILSRYPDYPKFERVIGEKFRLGEIVQSGKLPYQWGWLPWFSDRSYGLKIYAEIVKAAPYSMYAPLALMNTAILARQIGKPQAGIDALEQLIGSYPNSMLAPDAYLLMGQIYRELVHGPDYDQGPTRQAINFYKDFLILFPEDANRAHAAENLEAMSDTYARSKLILGDFYYRYRNNRKAALIFYNETITADTDSPAAREARAQIDKIKRGILPPPTIYDLLFGRYKSPTDRQFEEQLHYEAFANERFREETTDAFLSVPGAAVEDIIHPSGRVDTYEGLDELVPPIVP